MYRHYQRLKMEKSVEKKMNTQSYFEFFTIID